MATLKNSVTSQKLLVSKAENLASGLKMGEVEASMMTQTSTPDDLHPTKSNSLPAYAELVAQNAALLEQLHQMRKEVQALRDELARLNGEALEYMVAQKLPKPLLEKMAAEIQISDQSVQSNV